MDIVSMSPIPLFVYGDRSLMPKEVSEKQRKLEQKVKGTKLLITQDPEKQIYTQYKMKLKKGLSYEDINRVHRLIDQMLSSQVAGKQLLKEDKTAADLKRAFDEMLYSNTFCFDKLRDIYITSIKNDIVIEEPVRVFLGLFDVKGKREFTKKQFEDRIDRISGMHKKKACMALRNCIVSAPYNTLLIRNIQRRRIRYEKERRKSEAAVVKQKVR